MSKIGKKPIKIPNGITVAISPKDKWQEVSVTGPKGVLSQTVRPEIKVREENGSLLVEYKNPKDNALQGLYRSLIANMVKGVTEGWNKGLELKGVGFRALVTGDKLMLTVGFTNQIEFPIPKGIAITVAENKINVSGIDKQLVGEVSAKIRAVRPPEPYKGKGIRYIGEIVRKKAGKQAVKVGGGGA